jgi:hypothetical protein
MSLSSFFSLCIAHISSLLLFLLRPVLFFQSDWLLSAAEHGLFAMTKLLWKKGADVNKAEAHEGRTPLMVATSKGHAEMVKLLLEMGSLVDAVDIVCSVSTLPFVFLLHFLLPFAFFFLLFFLSF